MDGISLSGAGAGSSASNAAQVTVLNSQREQAVKVIGTLLDGVRAQTSGSGGNLNVVA